MPSRSHADDVAAICELKTRYCWYFDDGDLDGVVALFTDDAVCELGSFGSWRGREEIIAGYRGQMVDSQVPGGRIHALSNPLIEVAGDHATGRWYLVDYDISGGSEQQPIRLLASYRDEYRCVDGQWLIVRTALTIHWRAW
jgi:ketosteroid isomerase-like protein